MKQTGCFWISYELGCKRTHWIEFSLTSAAKEGPHSAQKTPIPQSYYLSESSPVRVPHNRIFIVSSLHSLSESESTRAIRRPSTFSSLWNIRLPVNVAIGKGLQGPCYLKRDDHDRKIRAKGTKKGYREVILYKYDQQSRKPTVCRSASGFSLQITYF